MIVREYKNVPNVKYSTRKNLILKKTRGVNFEDVEKALEDNSNILDIVDNPNYKGQFVLQIVIDNYPCSVPFLWNQDGRMFLKTVYKNRKLFRIYNIEKP